MAQVIKPAYLALVEAHGGSRSQAWKQKAKELVAEHVKRKSDSARKIALNAAELGSQMKSLNKRWSDDVAWGARLNMHIMYIIISGNPDLAASKHNTMVCGTRAMQKWCKAELPVVTSLLPKIHSYIVAETGLTGIRPTQAPKRMPRDMHGKRAACTTELTRLFEEHSGSEVGPRFPWATIPAFLIRHRLHIDNWPSTSEFPDILGLTVGSVRTEHWTNLWERLFATDDTKRLKISRLDVPQDQEISSTTAVMRNSDGLKLLVADWDGVVQRKKQSVGSSESTQVSGEQIAGGTDTGANLKKRQKKGDGAVENEGRKGVKRKKVISSSTIEDNDIPESSQSPLLPASTSAPPPFPVLPAALGIMPTAGPMSDLPILDITQGSMTAVDLSAIQLDFSDFPDLDPSHHQDLLLGSSAALL